MVNKFGNSEQLKTNNMTQELLDYCYKHEKEYVYEESQRLFDCLVELVESGTVTTFEGLAYYGMDY